MNNQLPKIQPSREVESELPIESSWVHDIRDQLNRDGTYSAVGPAMEILRRLELLSLFDEDSEKQQRFWAMLSWTTGLLTLLMVFLAFPSFGLTLILAVPFLIAFILVMRNYLKYGRLNVYNRRYEIPMGMLKRLGHDIPPHAKVEVSIDFNYYHAEKYQQGSPANRRYAVARTGKFEIVWLQLKGQFMDGTQFRFRITTNVKRKEKSKNKGTKVTETFREKYNLMLVVPGDRYPLVSEFPSRFLRRASQSPTVFPPKAAVEGNKVVIQSFGERRRYQNINSRKNAPFKDQGATQPLLVFKNAYTTLSELKV